MNASASKRLQLKHEETLAICRNKISQWEKYKKDYESLHETVRTLPDKTSHDMMVPLGPLALVPGKVVHTNEVIVLLGDDWFAERSCKQACEIIERRIKQCDAMLDKFHEEEENIKNWIGFTEEFRAEAKDCIDIVEPFDETEENLWREKHKRNVQKYNKQLAAERNKMQNMSTQSCLPEESIQEANPLQHNIASTSASGGYGDSEINTYRNKGRRVSWQDQSDQIVLKRVIEEDDVEESENEDDALPLTIYFTHSDSPLSQSENVNNTENPHSHQVVNPADIYIKYSHFLQKTPKSILKKWDSNTRGIDAETQPSIPVASGMRELNIDSEPKTLTAAVLPSVKEHNPNDQPPASSTSSRPTSRFKAQRSSAQKMI